MRRLLCLLLLSAPAFARTPQPTIVGTLREWKGPQNGFRLRLPDGSWKTCLLTKKHEYMRDGLPVKQSIFHEGDEVVIRVLGSMEEKVVSVDCLADLSSSPFLVCHSAPAPYFTHIGDYATTNGAGGRSPGQPLPTNPTSVIGILGNGGIDRDSPHSRAEAMASVLAPLGITQDRPLQGVVLAQQSGELSLRLDNGQVVSVSLPGEAGECVGRTVSVRGEEISAGRWKASTWSFLP